LVNGHAPALHAGEFRRGLDVSAACEQEYCGYVMTRARHVVN
jgi:hypothetical protein